MGNDLLHVMNQRSDELNFRHLVATPAETIFSFWTDADRLVRWMGRRAEIEPSLGGLFIVDLTGDDIVFGRVVLIEPPNRLELPGVGAESASLRSIPVHHASSSRSRTGLPRPPFV